MTTTDGNGAADPVSHDEHRAGRLARVLNWLRAGYPDGVPAAERTALYGILHRSLSDDEVAEIATTLRHERGDHSATHDEIVSAIEEATHEHPSEGDVARVAATLASVGWPLESHALDEPPAATDESLTDLAPAAEAPQSPGTDGSDRPASA